MANDGADITLLPLGVIERRVLAHVAAAVTRAFPGHLVAVSPAGRLPRGIWNTARGQCDSTRLIRYLDRHQVCPAGKLLAICDTDLCTQILTFVFGEAEVGGCYAVMSLHRLRPEVYGMPRSEALFFDRSGKEAIHELGHTFGLRHCYRYDCVMHSSDSIEATDLKREGFCPRCRSLVPRAPNC
ncbi:MAG: archaemetzincin family Zn-dependent metalloprotease [Candidatus Eisenbacteria bacterium]|nr:archaemetzincin family Zn-dependent metalloprotease [Candidatus Eisenbacteria bacterium]